MSSFLSKNMHLGEILKITQMFAIFTLIMFEI